MGNGMEDGPFDWARKEAIALLYDYASQDTVSYGEHSISQALRKAKADGMREAADIMDALPTLGQFLTGLEKVRARASEIEKAPTE